MEIFLWLFIVPWFFYSRWRGKNSGYVCKDCRNQNVVKISKDDALKVDLWTANQRLEALEKLSALKEKGIVTEEEFELKKKELMG